MNAEATLPCPLQSMQLPGIDQAVTLRGLIVVVGPNSSGKSNLLRDLEKAANGNLKNGVVVEQVAVTKLPQGRELATALVDRQIVKLNEGSIRPLVRPAQVGYGVGNRVVVLES